MTEKFFQCRYVSRVVDPFPVDLLLGCRRSRLPEVSAVKHHSRIRFELTRIGDQLLSSGHEPQAMGAGCQIPSAWRPAHRKSNIVDKQLITGTHSLENQPSHEPVFGLRTGGAGDGGDGGASWASSNEIAWSLVRVTDWFLETYPLRSAVTL